MNSNLQNTKTSTWKYFVAGILISTIYILLMFLYLDYVNHHGNALRVENNSTNNVNPLLNQILN